MAEKSVTIRIIGDASKAQKAFNEAGTSAATFEGKIDGLGSKFGTFAGTLGGVVAGGALASLPGLLLDGAKGAAEDQAAMDRLRTAVENTGTAYDSRSQAIDEAIKKGQELAFTDGDTAEALGTLISLTGSTDEGMRRLSSAQDLARGTGISLQQAALLLGKTSDENTAALSRMGIQLGENATAQDVLNAVDAKFQGQAGTYAASAAGQMEIATQQAGELAESFGGFLIPILTLLTGVMLQVADAIQTYVVPAVQGIINAIAPVAEFIGGFIADNIGPFVAALIGIGTAILVTVIPAMVAWVAGTIPVIAAHVTMAAAVIAAYLPIIAIVAAVGVAAALLYKAWESNLFGIRDITQQVWDFVRPYFETAISAIQTVIETVFPIIATVVTTYIGILRTEIELGVAAAKFAFDNVFVPIQGVVQDVMSTIANIVTTVWGPAVEAIKTGVAAAKMVYDEVFVPIQGVVSDVFNTILNLVNTLWLGASGAVGLIGSGVSIAKDAFAGVYDTFSGYGHDIMQGLIDGIVSLWDTFSGWIDKLTDKLKIDVPGFSPPYHAGYEQGRDFVLGLTDGISSGAPDYQRTLDGVTGGMGNAPAPPPPGGGMGNAPVPGSGVGAPPGSDTGPRGGPAYTPPPVIGDAISYSQPELYHEGSRGGGSGKGAFGGFGSAPDNGFAKEFSVTMTKATDDMTDANHDYLRELSKRDEKFLQRMGQYVEAIKASNEAVPREVGKAVRSALASAI